jgi:hypothetical protein
MVAKIRSEGDTESLQHLTARTGIEDRRAHEWHGKSQRHSVSGREEIANEREGTQPTAMSGKEE